MRGAEPMNADERVLPTARPATRGDLLWSSIPAMAADAAKRFGDAEAVVDGTRGVSFAATRSELRPQLANLELVIGFDGASHADHSLESFGRLGERVGAAELDARIGATGPDDVCDVLFTSGTTGAPKGVLMTHAQ